LRIEDEDHPELLDPYPQAGLDLDHLHEGFFPGLVVHGHSSAAAAARKENLHAEVAEDSVAGGILHGLFRTGLNLVKTVQRFTGHLPNLLLLLCLLRCLRTGCAGEEHSRQGDSENNPHHHA